MSRREGERIYYVVPEDGDSEEHPNVFVLPGPAGLDVKLADVKHFFPLGAQGFHFRFLRRIGGQRAWVDVGEDRQTVPRFDGGEIVVKASRLQLSDPDEGRLGAIKSFLAGVGGDDESQPIGKMKSMFTKACSGVFQREDDSGSGRDAEPGFPRPGLGPGGTAPTRGPSARGPQSGRPPQMMSTRGDNGHRRDFPPETVSAPAQSAQRPKQPPVVPRFAAKPLKSSTDLEAEVKRQTRTVKSASPPRSAASVPTPILAPPASPPPPPKDLLNLDHSPTQQSQPGHAKQPDDWNAFVGLDSAPQAAPQAAHQPFHPPPRQQPMMHPGPSAHVDPFALPHPQVNPSNKPQGNDFDAFISF